MSHYLIKKDVYFCYAGTLVVFLDLERNEYSAIDRNQASALNGTVAGWEAPESNTSGHGDSGNSGRTAKQIAENLLKRGVLTHSQETGKEASPTRFRRPTADLLSEYELSKPSIGLFHVIRFVRSYLYVMVSLRAVSLGRIAHRISARREQVGQERCVGSIAEARQLVLVYDYLRPFFFRASEKCLLNSLVLIEFLQHYNVFPTWVIGVSTNPFRAHSWLEIDGLVVDDQEMHVKKFVPIMAR